MTTIEDCYLSRAWKRIALYERSRRREVEAERDEALAQIECARELLLYSQARGERSILIGPVLRSLDSTPEDRAMWGPLPKDEEVSTAT